MPRWWLPSGVFLAIWGNFGSQVLSERPILDICPISRAAKWCVGEPYAAVSRKVPVEARDLEP